MSCLITNNCVNSYLSFINGVIVITATAKKHKSVEDGLTYSCDYSKYTQLILTSITRALRDMLGWVCLRKELMQSYKKKKKKKK